jgi:hypothetical protein
MLHAPDLVFELEQHFSGFRIHDVLESELMVSNLFHDEVALF